MIQKLKRELLDLIFPPHCINCGHLGSFICPKCEAGVVKIKNQACPLCHRDSTHGKLCSGCAPKSKLNGMIAFGYFRDPLVKEAVHRFKYEELSALGYDLARLLAATIVREDLEFDLITYVPVSRKRRNERGYNQAEILARELSRLLERPLFRGLVKEKHTKPQVGLKRNERLQNTENSFLVKNIEVVEGRTVLVVDDVFTTGSTTGECARVLKIAGAKKVWAAVLARE